MVRPSRAAAVKDGPASGPPGGLVLDGREHGGRLVCVGIGRMTTLVIDRGEIPNRGMTAARVVEALDELEHRGPRLGLRLEPTSVEKLAFQRGEGKIPLQGSRTTLCQITRDGFPAMTGYPNCEMIDSAGRAPVVERDQCFGVAEPNNFNSSLLCLARYSKAEHLPIEVDGALQISDLNADMVDVCSFEIDVFLSGGSRAARRQHRETLNQFSTGE